MRRCCIVAVLALLSIESVLSVSSGLEGRLYAPRSIDGPWPPLPDSHTNGQMALQSGLRAGAASEPVSKAVEEHANQINEHVFQPINQGLTSARQWTRNTTYAARKAIAAIYRSENFYLYVFVVSNTLVYMYKAIMNHDLLTVVKGLISGCLVLLTYLLNKRSGRQGYLQEMQRSNATPGDYFNLFLSLALFFFITCFFVETMLDWIRTTLELTEKSTQKYDHNPADVTEDGLVAMSDYLNQHFDVEDRDTLFSYIVKNPGGCAYLDQLLALYEPELKKQLRVWEEGSIEAIRPTDPFSSLSDVSEEGTDDQDRQPDKRGNLDQRLAEIDTIKRDIEEKKKSYCPTFPMSCAYIIFKLDSSYHMRDNTVAGPETSFLEYPNIVAPSEPRNERSLMTIESLSANIKNKNLPHCDLVTKESARNLCSHATDPCPYNAYRVVCSEVIGWLQEETKVVVPKLKNFNSVVWLFVIVLVMWIIGLSEVNAVGSSCPPLMAGDKIRARPMCMVDSECDVSKFSPDTEKNWDDPNTPTDEQKMPKIYHEKYTVDIPHAAKFYCPTPAVNPQAARSVCFLECEQGYVAYPKETVCESQGLYGSMWSHLVVRNSAGENVYKYDDYNIAYESISRCEQACKPTFLKWNSSISDFPLTPTSLHEVRLLQQDCTCTGYTVDKDTARTECKSGGYCFVYGTQVDGNADSNQWGLASFCLDPSTLGEKDQNTGAVVAGASSKLGLDAIGDTIKEIFDKTTTTVLDASETYGSLPGVGKNMIYSDVSSDLAYWLTKVEHASNGDMEAVFGLRPSNTGVLSPTLYVKDHPTCELTGLDYDGKEVKLKDKKKLEKSCECPGHDSLCHRQGYCFIWKKEESDDEDATKYGTVCVDSSNLLMDGVSCDIDNIEEENDSLTQLFSEDSTKISLVGEIGKTYATVDAAYLKTLDKDDETEDELIMAKIEVMQLDVINMPF